MRKPRSCLDGGPISAVAEVATKNGAAFGVSPNLGALDASETSFAAFREPATRALISATAHQTKKPPCGGFPVLVEVARMDSLLRTSALRAALARLARPKRASLRFVNPLRELSSRPLPTKQENRLAAVFLCWWRWRESNSRPQVLRYEIYMLIPSLISL